MSTRTDSPVLIAVDNPALHPEAIHLAAATGRPVVDARDTATLRQHAPRAHTILIDEARAPDLNDTQRRGGVYMLADDPSAINFEAAMRARADDVFLVPAQSGELLATIGQAGARGDDNKDASGAVIVVTSSAGGAGASVLAGAIASIATPDTQPVLIDANPYSGGLDLLFGIEDIPGARWGDIALGEGDVHRSDLRHAFPTTKNGIALLTVARSNIAQPGDIDAEAVDTLISSLAVGGLTVVDTPAAGIPARCDLVVVVVPQEVRAVAAAARIAAECRARSQAVVAVSRARDWSGVTVDEIEQITGMDVCAELPHIARLTRTLEISGIPARLPRALTQAAGAVLERAGVPA